MAGLPTDTLAELRALVAQGEGARVEFKAKQLRTAKKIEFRGAPNNGGYYLLTVTQ